MRLRVTSGTTGDPVAIGLTRADHAANSAIGRIASWSAGGHPPVTVTAEPLGSARVVR